MAVNLWPNADLESGISEWNVQSAATLTSSTAQSWSTDGGTHSLLIEYAGTYDGTNSDVRSVVSESTQYTISFYLYSTSETQTYSVYVYDQDDNQIAVAGDWTTALNAWARKTVTFNTGAGDTGIKLNIISWTPYVGGELYVDGIMLETGASASAWVNYISPGVDVTPPLLTTRLVMFDPIVEASSQTWDMGPFALTYSEEQVGVAINPQLLQTTIQIHDPVVYAVDVPTAVAPPLLQTSIQLFNPTVNAGTFRNRIASILHLIMGR